MTRQIPLPLPHDIAMGGDDFLVTPSNREAAAWIEKWPDWSAHGLIVTGDAGSGKTHLLNLWLAKSNGLLVAQPQLIEQNSVALAAHDKNIAIDNADKIVGDPQGEEALFHLYNHLKSAGGSLVLAMQKPPGHAGFVLPDLRSRLLTLPVAALAAPDDHLLEALIVKQFRDRQIDLDAGVVAYLTPRMPREAAAARELVEQLDQASLAEGRKITIALARKIWKMSNLENLKTSDFDFDLPQELIAQQAVEPRDHARLLRITPEALEDKHIYDLPDLLRAGDLLVMNDTRVIPARLYGKRGEMKVEVLLHKKTGSGTWLAFARPGKRLRVGETIIFADDFSAEILEKHESGEILLRFNTQDGALLQMLRRYGEPPLPPYIKRETGAAKADTDRYQTVYAAKDGAVAAPTAGLHFTPELLQKLKDKGIEQVKVTLHVGAGTFLPVKADYLKDHVMHAEYGEISETVAATINKTKSEGRRIVAVGTTSLRVLESAADATGIVQPFARDTSIFITPGYQFRAVDALLTNFHLPQSTLFMLVSAFMGMEKMRAAYAHAIKSGYRFYSYGDGSLLERG